MIDLPLYHNSAFDLHVFNSSQGNHLYVAPGSRVYDIDNKTTTTIKEIQSTTSKEYDDSLLKSLGLFISDQTPDIKSFSPTHFSSISLNVAQSCNMSCGYCYADSGKFGGSARMMSTEIAKKSIDRLILESKPGSNLLVGYIGGEPMLNRNVVYETTQYAYTEAKKKDHKISFSITTNGTVLKKEDIILFNKFPFTVTMSIDGDRNRNDTVRKMNDGSSSYDQLRDSLFLFEQFGRPEHLAARVTVTPKSGTLLPILDHIISLGFDEVGFAAVVVSPVPKYEFSQLDFQLFLKQMILCGKKALSVLSKGGSYPFGNFETALYEIHRGSCRPFPCGAAAGYLSANAEGNLFACHRLIDDPEFAVGDVQVGSNVLARSRILETRHVDSMIPCKECWARYLCGGGCYHEVSKRGRISCDYIRGWLDFCLRAYIELSSKFPEYFLNHNLKKTLSNTTTLSM